MNRISSTRGVIALAVIGALGSTATARAGSIWGGPTFDATAQTGYEYGGPPISGNGVAIENTESFSGGTDLGPRAILWNTSGAAPIELGNLGTSTDGAAQTMANGINSAGVAVGFAAKIMSISNTITLGNRAVRWDASGNVTELGNIGTNPYGQTDAAAYAINSSGVAVGTADKFVDTFAIGTPAGSRAVRWDALGNATELDTLGTDSYGSGSASAIAINDAGTAVGYAQKYDSSGNGLGQVAVRWGASGTAVTELGNLGTNASGVTTSEAFAINSAGTAIGFAEKYTSGTDLGSRAVRWSASGTVATELGNLGTDASGSTSTGASAINSAGTIVGTVGKYSGGMYVCSLAVRWDASGTAATELGILGTDSSGNTAGSQGNAINTAGTIVGTAEAYSGGIDIGSHAVLWNSNGVAIDLNTLLSPNSGWTLGQATGISDNNIVTGIGFFDPDGSGPLEAYTRPFMLDVSSAVPEPSSVTLLTFAAFAGQRTRRKKGSPRTR